MTQDRKQTARLRYWWGSAVLLIVVFFTVRALTRDRLQVRVENASIARRQVDLQIVGEEPRARAPEGDGRGKRRRR